MGNVIEVNNLGKLYRLGEIGTGTLARDINSWWAGIRGKENPNKRIGEINDRSVKGSSEFVWSLKDINFEVKQGEVLGIIGKNGAGKSTLLKILSRVTAPTTGEIKIKGRIASLLEVGTGFHPDLTGKENVYLNGAILGMRKAEIKRKFDDIIDFAGIARYINTPVKRYSSGMTVRLAFAVAAFLEAEILLLDEVLAVGDAAFQKRCLGKMQDISQKEGRTVLFVSHNMTAVESLCNKAIFLSNGLFEYGGSTKDVINRYLQENVTDVTKRVFNEEEIEKQKGAVKTKSIELVNDHPQGLFDVNSSIYLSVTNDFLSSGQFVLDVQLYNLEGLMIFNSCTPMTEFSTGIYTTRVAISSNLLNNGNYVINFAVLDGNLALLYQLRHVLAFQLHDNPEGREIAYLGEWKGIIRPKLKWEINKQ
ncbi:MAG: ATP-binding cassette domain-containing protein [Taibaiella sp.]|nr:ATP-binding cassette domain-containing protein [Taibaiella sp.]